MTDRPSLRRVLGFSDVFNFLVGTVIGSGVFLVSAAMASAVGSPTLMLGVWVLGGALSLFGALALAELGAAYPESGGMYVYLREAYGPLVAFLFGWTSFLVIEGGGIATLSSAFATRYLPFFVDLSPVAQRLVAVTLIMSLAVINVLGVRGSAMVPTFSSSGTPGSPTRTSGPPERDATAQGSPDIIPPTSPALRVDGVLARRRS